MPDAKDFHGAGSDDGETLASYTCQSVGSPGQPSPDTFAETDGPALPAMKSILQRQATGTILRAEDMEASVLGGPSSVTGERNTGAGSVSSSAHVTQLHSLMCRAVVTTDSGASATGPCRTTTGVQG
eukprot:scaffold1318_cov388-Prasinococcus_capsulatus_cf.AAC.90